MCTDYSTDVYLTDSCILIYKNIDRILEVDQIQQGNSYGSNLTNINLYMHGIYTYGTQDYLL